MPLEPEMPIPLCPSIKEAQVIDLPKQTKHRGTWLGQMWNNSLLLVQLKDVEKCQKIRRKVPSLIETWIQIMNQKSITFLPTVFAHNAVGSSHSGTSHQKLQVCGKGQRSRGRCRYQKCVSAEDKCCTSQSPICWVRMMHINCVYLGLREESMLRELIAKAHAELCRDSTLIARIQNKSAWTEDPKAHFGVRTISLKKTGSSVFCGKACNISWILLWFHCSARVFKNKIKPIKPRKVTLVSCRRPCDWIWGQSDLCHKAPTGSKRRHCKQPL